jgi:hypothetical protein
MEEHSPQVPSVRQGGDNLGQKVIAYKWHLCKDDLVKGGVKGVLPHI